MPPDLSSSSISEAKRHVRDCGACAPAKRRRTGEQLTPQPSRLRRWTPVWPMTEQARFRTTGMTPRFPSAMKYQPLVHSVLDRLIAKPVVRMPEVQRWFGLLPDNTVGNFSGAALGNRGAAVGEQQRSGYAAGLV